jgi:iron complex outermembrane receptor protein
MNKRILLLSSAFCALSLSGGAAMAATAEAEAEAAGGGTTIGELVVTAEKREQNLQDVPVAISAYTAAKRDLVGINTVQDITNFTPGLQYSAQTDRISLRGVGRLNNSHAADSSVAVYSDSIYSTSTVQAGETPIFIDRVEVLRGPQGTLYGRASVGGAINIVSKKPTKDWYAEVRGTYANYNHSLVEGAVSGPLADNVQFRLAGNWERQTKGWFKNVSTNGAPDEGWIINTIFVEGQLAIQFNDKLETWAKVSLIEWHNGAGGPGSRSSWAPFPYNIAQQTQSNNLVPNAGFAYSGLATNVVTSCPAVKVELNDARTICYDTPGTVKLNDTVIVANHWTYHADGFDIKYITGGTHYHYTLTGDQDATGVSSYSTCYTLGAVARASCIAGTTAPITYPTRYTFNYQEIERWWSHEVNLVSTGNGPFQWLVGAFYYNESYEQPVYTQLPDESRLDTVVASAVGGLALPDPSRHIFDNRPHFHLRSRAVFTQVDWKFTDTLKATVGLRVGDDHKVGRESVRIIFAPGTLNPTLPVDVTPVLGLVGGPGVTGVFDDPATGFRTRTYDATFSAVTGTGVLQWTPTEDVMAYGKYSRGYKAGGFRIGIDTSLGGNPETQKETIDAFEIGLKTNIGRTFQANIDAFYYDYTNAQVPLAQPAAGGGSVANSILFNVPKARSQGVEVETIWQPIDNLQILANYSYLDAHVTKGLAIDPADSCALAPGARQTQLAGVTDAFCNGPQYFQDISGYRLPNSAKHRVTLNANYTYQMDSGALTGSVTYVWRGAQFGSIFDRPYYRAPSWAQVDARLTWKSANGKYTIIGFGKNIFNQLGYANGNVVTRRAGTTPTFANPTLSPPLTGVFGQNSVYELTPPRTFGVEVQYKFF